MLACKTTDASPQPPISAASHIDADHRDKRNGSSQSDPENPAPVHLHPPQSFASFSVRLPKFQFPPGHRFEPAPLLLPRKESRHRDSRLPGNSPAHRPKVPSQKRYDRRQLRAVASPIQRRSREKSWSTHSSLIRSQLPKSWQLGKKLSRLASLGLIGRRPQNPEAALKATSARLFKTACENNNPATGSRKPLRPRSR